MVITIRYHLQTHTPARGTALAADIIYGLSTCTLLLLLVRVYDISADHINRPPGVVAAEDNLRLHILQHVEKRVNAGHEPPPLAPLFASLTSDPMRGLSSRAVKALGESPASQAIYAAYVQDLRARIGGLEYVNIAREY